MLSNILCVNSLNPALTPYHPAGCFCNSLQGYSVINYALRRFAILSNYGNINLWMLAIRNSYIFRVQKPGEVRIDWKILEERINN